MNQSGRPVRLNWTDRPRNPPPVQSRQLRQHLRFGAGKPGVGAARLVAGDAVAVADQLLAEGLAGTFHLAHLDPPFGSEADYSRRRALPLDGRLLGFDLPAYGDTDHGDLAGYLDALYPLFCRYHELLAPQGALYLHIDYRRGPYLRMLLDEIFGADNLVNQIVWAYGLGGSSRRRFQRKHDIILYYARSARHRFFRPQQEDATSSMLAGQPKGATDTWTTVNRDDASPIERDWPDELVRKTLSNRDPERTGYPTQKPLALAMRMIRASVPDGGQVLDLMAGSGTVGLAAALLGHEVVLGDRGDPALDVTRGRLLAAGVRLALQGVDGAGAWSPWPGPPPCSVSDGVAVLDPTPLPWPAGAVRAAPAIQSALAAAARLDGAGLFAAWGLGVVAEDGAVDVCAHWDQAALRQRGALQRTLPLPSRVDRGGLQWWAVDVLGRRWCGPIDLR